METTRTTRAELRRKLAVIEQASEFGAAGLGADGEAVIETVVEEQVEVEPTGNQELEANSEEQIDQASENSAAGLGAAVELEKARLDIARLQAELEKSSMQLPPAPHAPRRIQPVNHDVSLNDAAESRRDHQNIGEEQEVLAAMDLQQDVK